MDDTALGGFPRIVVAGMAGDSGKTLVSMGITLLARGRGMEVAAFKKGPDFIDAAWLAWASGRCARNLDTHLMGFSDAVASFLRHGEQGSLNLIEGNRGLFDGLDSRGAHSTAELAKALQAPVLLVLNASKMTRTSAALVLGCRALDPGLNLGGVILNNIAGSRHESVLRESVETAAGVRVLGAIPRLPGDSPLPDRHLGLLPPQEHAALSGLSARIAEACSPHLDMEAILALARSAPPLARAEGEALPQAPPAVTIGYLSDSAFTFYYPDNLEALARCGARLRPCSPLSGEPFPRDLDALYIGGGFPETHAEALSANGAWMEDLRTEAEGGLPVYAECGGLMLLSRAIHWRGQRFPMAGALPFEVEVLPKPQGHGYAALVVDRANPFFDTGVRLKGHEFHYSRIMGSPDAVGTACRVERGTGCFPGRDAVIQGAIWAAYTHLHALSSPEWAPALVARALRHRKAAGRR